MNSNAILALVLGSVFAFLAWMTWTSGTVSIRGFDYYREDSEGVFLFWLGTMVLGAAFFFYNAFLIVTGTK